MAERASVDHHGGTEVMNMSHLPGRQKRRTVLMIVALAGALALVAVAIGQGVGGSGSTGDQPNKPAVAYQTVQRPSTTPASTPTQASLEPLPGLAELVATAATLNTASWVPSQNPQVLLTARVPPTYTSTLRVLNLAIGAGQIHELVVMNPAAASRPPLKEGVPVPGGELSLTVQLYPSGPIIPAQDGDWKLVDSTSLQLPTTKQSTNLGHYVDPDGRSGAIILRGKHQLPDGRVLDVLGRVTDPASNDDVRTLIRIAESIEVR